MITADIRMLPELVHECSVAGFDDLLWSVRLNMQDSVIVSFVFHGPKPELILSTLTWIFIVSTL
jgi:hypothetical protein